MSLVLLFICLWVFFFYVSFISFCCPFLFPIFACCSCPLRCSLTAPGSLQNMRREPRMARLCRCRGFKLQLWPCRTQSLANWLLQGVGSERMERWWSIIYSCTWHTVDIYWLILIISCSSYPYSSSIQGGKVGATDFPMNTIIISCCTLLCFIMVSHEYYTDL